MDTKKDGGHDNTPEARDIEGVSSGFEGAFESKTFHLPAQRDHKKTQQQLRPEE